MSFHINHKYSFNFLMICVITFPIFFIIFSSVLHIFSTFFKKLSNCHNLHLINCMKVIVFYQPCKGFNLTTFSIVSVARMRKSLFIYKKPKLKIFNLKKNIIGITLIFYSWDKNVPDIIVNRTLVTAEPIGSTF